MSIKTNLDILVSRQGTDAFAVRVIDSPQGRSEGEARFPLEKAADGLRAPDIDAEVIIPLNVESLDASTAQRVGAALYRALVFDDRVQELLSAVIGASGGAVRLRFQIEPSDLRRVPFELIYRDPEGFLSLAYSVTRYAAAGALPLRTLLTPPPLNLLIVSAAPDGFPPLDADREIGRVRMALAEAERAGLVAIHELRNPTISQVRARLRTARIHVLHFIGHGSADGSAPVLAFADENGKPSLISAEIFAANAAGQDTLRLVVLNACDTAVESAPLVGIAPKLLQRAGLPAVIAMQDKIGDNSAIAFARALYDAVARGEDIDRAVREGRLAIFSSEGARARRDFVVPVLFLRPTEARLIDFPAHQRERIAVNLRTMMAAEPSGQTQAMPMQLAELAELYARLAALKELHDLLQTLDGTFELVLRELERPPDAADPHTPWSLCRTQIERIKQAAANPRSPIVITPFREGSDGALSGEAWAVELVTAANRFDAALRDGLPAARTLRLARRVSQTIQTHLNISDKSMLDASRPLMAFDSAPFGGAAAELDALHQRLLERLTLHHLLQDLTNGFRRVRDETRRPLTDTSAIDDAWRFVRANGLDSGLRRFAEQMGALERGTNGVQRGQPWAVELLMLGDRIDAALDDSQPNPTTLVAASRDFDAALRRQFFIADRTLKDITTELQTLSGQFTPFAEVDI